MKPLYAYLIAAAVVILMFLLAACSTGALSVSLTVISDACVVANVTVPILEASGVVPAPIGNLILNYAASVSTAAAEASQELLSTDPPAVQASKIISDFASVVAPALGPTVGPEVISIVQAIQAAVNEFVEQFKSPTAQKAIKSGALDHQKLPFMERRALGTLHNKFLANAAKSKSLLK
jgi:hypothetical protein